MQMKPIQTFINREAKSLLNMIDAFRDLLPHERHSASVHSGEEGRAIEIIVREYLRDKLPNALGVGCGFLIDPGQQWRSRQLDVIVYDQNNFAPVFRYGDAIVAHVAAAVGVISVKRTLYNSEIASELASLTAVGSIAGKYPHAKPFLALLAFDTDQRFRTAFVSIQQKIREYYAPKPTVNGGSVPFCWGELVDAIAIPDKLLIRLKALDQPSEKRAKPPVQQYIWSGANKNYQHIYFQTLLRGIKRRYFDDLRAASLDGIDQEYFPSAEMSHFLDVTVAPQARRPNVWSHVELGYCRLRFLRILSMRKNGAACGSRNNASL